MLDTWILDYFKKIQKIALTINTKVVVYISNGEMVVVLRLEMGIAHSYSLKRDKTMENKSTS